MTPMIQASARYPQALATALFAAISLVLTFGLSCAVPLAGFAATAAVILPRGAATGAILAAWLANQMVGFLWLGYPTDGGTLAWGLALGVIAVGCLGAARAALARMAGAAGIGAALIAAFGVYEGAIYAICLASGTDVARITVALVAWIFLVNAATYAVCLGFWTVAVRSGLPRRIVALLGLPA